MATPSTIFHDPGFGNVFIPAFAPVPGATGLLQVEFSRNPSSFAINKYCQVAPGAAQAGLYLILDTDEAIRLVNLQDNIWPDGNDAPAGENRPLKWDQYNCIRYAPAFTIGDETNTNAQRAGWDVIASHARMAATKAMTIRTHDVTTLITTSGNWAGNTSADLTAFGITGAASWYLSNATTEQFIKKTVHKLVRDIMKKTGGAVRAGDLQLVVGPDTAHQMSETEEIHAYIVNHEQAITAMQERSILDTYGLPPVLYGLNVVVEDGLRVTAKREAGETAQSVGGSFMLADKKAVVTSRPGGLMGGVPGAVTFSTVTIFVKEDMTVESMHDALNRRTRGRVVDNFDVVMTAPLSGYLIEDVST